MLHSRQGPRSGICIPSRVTDCENSNNNGHAALVLFLEYFGILIPDYELEKFLQAMA